MKIVFTAVLALTLLSCSTKEKRDPSTTDLPPIEISTLTGETLDAKEIEGKAILILFQPDCDHCQHEAEDIEANLDLFSEYKLYFVSSATADEVRAFATTYKLAGKDKVVFGTSPGEGVYNFFGPIQVPSIYIYSADGKLKKTFNGQVEINELSRAL